MAAPGRGRRDGTDGRATGQSGAGGSGAGGFDLLFANICTRIDLSRSEWRIWKSFFHPRRLRKQQFFLQEGEVASHIAFVVRGCLRMYSVDDAGEEHVSQFAIRDWWLTDLSSFLSRSPATHFIDALVDSELLVLERLDRDRLLDAAPRADRFFRLLQEAGYVASHRRIDSLLRDSATERYLAFQKDYPRLVGQIPQHQVASYLGVTPQSLSRIRRGLSSRRRGGVTPG